MPPDKPTHSYVRTDATTSGSFAVDEVLNAALRERPLVSIVLPAYEEEAILRDHVLVLLEYLKTLLAIAGLQDAETTVFQIGGEARAHYFVIIDYQQRGTGFWHVGKRRQN